MGWFGKRQRMLQLRMPAVDGSTWPTDPAGPTVMGSAFAGRATFEIAQRLATELAARRIADRLDEALGDRLLSSTSAEDRPYLRKTLHVACRLGAVLGAGAEKGAALEPGKKYGIDTLHKVDFISLGLALVLGTAGLPHILMRFYTVPSAKEARRSVVWAIGLIGVFYLFTLVLGYGAAEMVGPEKILGAPGAANSAAPLLAYELGGTLLLGLVSAIAFSTILAVVAGLTITASASLAHDIYASVIHRGNAPAGQEVKVARIAAVVIGIVAIAGGIAANGQNIAFLVALAFAVAASANLPTLLYSLFWKRFNTRGCLWSIYGGLILTVGLIIFSPAVSGNETAMFPKGNWDLFPLANPGLVSIPASFFLGWLGTVTSDEHLAYKAAEMEVKSLTGAGVEGHVSVH